MGAAQALADVLKSRGYQIVAVDSMRKTPQSYIDDHRDNKEFLASVRQVIGELPVQTSVAKTRADLTIILGEDWKAHFKPYEHPNASPSASPAPSASPEGKPSLTSRLPPGPPHPPLHPLRSSHRPPSARPAPTVAPRETVATPEILLPTAEAPPPPPLPVPHRGGSQPQRRQVLSRLCGKPGEHGECDLIRPARSRTSGLWSPWLRLLCHSQADPSPDELQRGCALHTPSPGFRPLGDLRQFQALSPHPTHGPRYRCGTYECPPPWGV